MPRFHEILSYQSMCNTEQMSLQRGMNFRVRGGKAGYSILLMSVRKGAPYQDQWHDTGGGGPHAGMLEYEGHDAPKNVALRSDPKEIDQAQFLPSRKPTDNGKFFQAAADAQAGADPEIVQI
ncbi:MAG: hypothetical protein ACREJD_07870 [Phycisphaerales bacterium]